MSYYLWTIDHKAAGDDSRSKAEVNRCTLTFDALDLQLACKQRGAFLHIVESTRKENRIGDEADAVVCNLQV
jgi:hypothetical protein